LFFAILCFIIQLIRSFLTDDTLLTSLYQTHAMINMTLLSGLLLAALVTRNNRKLYHVYGYLGAILFTLTSLRTALILEEPGFTLGAFIILFAASATMNNILWFSLTLITTIGAYFYVAFYKLDMPDYLMESNALYAAGALSAVLFFSRRSRQVNQIKTHRKLINNEQELRAELEKREKWKSLLTKHINDSILLSTKSQLASSGKIQIIDMWDATKNMPR
jgi:hypothetical protein